MILGLSLILCVCLGGILLSAAASPDPALQLAMWAAVVRVLAFSALGWLVEIAWGATRWRWCAVYLIGVLDTLADEPIVSMSRPDLARACVERAARLRRAIDPPAPHVTQWHKLRATDEQGRVVTAHVSRCQAEGCSGCETSVQLIFGEHQDVYLADPSGEGRDAILIKEGHVVSGPWAEVRLAPVVLAYAAESEEVRALFAAIDRAEGFGDEEGEAA